MARVNRGIGLTLRAKVLNEAGQSMAEYIIIAVLVAIIVIVAVRKFGGGVSSQMSNATEMVASVGDDLGDTSGSTPSVADRAPKERERVTGFKDSDAGRGAGGGSGRDNSPDSLRARGVGTSSYTPIETVSIDWSLISMLGAGVVLAGIGVVVYLRRRTGKGGKKQKKNKLDAVKSKIGNVD